MTHWAEEIGNSKITHRVAQPHWQNPFCTVEILIPPWRTTSPSRFLASLQSAFHRWLPQQVTFALPMFRPSDSGDFNLLNKPACQSAWHTSNACSRMRFCKPCLPSAQYAFTGPQVQPVAGQSLLLLPNTAIGSFDVDHKLAPIRLSVTQSFLHKIASGALTDIRSNPQCLVELLVTHGRGSVTMNATCGGRWKCRRVTEDTHCDHSKRGRPSRSPLPGNRIR